MMLEKSPHNDYKTLLPYTKQRFFNKILVEQHGSRPDLFCQGLLWNKLKNITRHQSISSRKIAIIYSQFKKIGAVDETNIFANRH